MKRSTILRWFTIAMIVLFVAEIIFIGVNQSGQGNDQPTPTPPVITAAPQAEFNGNALAMAGVAGLGDELLVRCNSSSAYALMLGAPNVTGVTSDTERGIYDVSLVRGTDALEVSRILNRLLANLCDVSVMRFAFLSFNDSVMFSSQTDNASQSLPPQAFSCLSDQSGRCFALVNPTTRAGDHIEVSMFVRLVGGDLERLLVQEQQSPISSVKTIPAQGTVASLEPLTAAFADIPWAKRQVDQEAVEAALGVGIEEFNYFPDSSFSLPLQDNDTADALGNLSFAESVSQRETETLVFVAGNFSDEALAKSSLLLLGVNATPVFPVSKLSLLANTSDENATAAALEEFFGVPVVIKRAASVELADVPSLEKELGASFGNQTGTQMLVPAGLEEGDLLGLDLTVFITLGEIGSFSASVSEVIPAPEATPTPTPAEDESDASPSPSAVPTASPDASPSGNSTNSS
ncbi:MAG: hypothetical protein V1787_06735 [Candidatus Micrarchaeota archaeon]